MKHNLYYRSVDKKSFRKVLFYANQLKNLKY